MILNAAKSLFVRGGALDKELNGYSIYKKDKTNMPIYEYECQSCFTKFEVGGTFESLLLLKPICPNCKNNNIKKIISVPFVQYKGNGFYSTDKKEISK